MIMFFWEYFCIFLLLIVVKCQADVCRSSCESTYPLHTTDKVVELKACLTGCRISFITQLSSNVLKSNETTTKCKQDCDDGYKQKELAAACHVGCQAQLTERIQQEGQELASLLELTWHRQLMNPFHHIGRYCSSMYRNVATYMISSVDMGDGSGSTVIMEFQLQPAHHAPIQIEEKVKKDEGVSIKRYMNLAYQHGKKWLNCVERRAGIPYWSLVGVLFLSLFFMCWVCCSSCDDENERHGSKKHVFKDEVSVHADPIALEKPPPYFIIEYEAGPLPEKLPLID